MWKNTGSKSRRKAETGVLWQTSYLVLQPGGPLQEALGLVHAAALPMGSAPKHEAQEGGCGEGISGGKVSLLAGGKCKPEANHHENLRNTDCGVGREDVAQHCTLEKISL